VKLSVAVAAGVAFAVPLPLFPGGAGACVSVSLKIKDASDLSPRGRNFAVAPDRVLIKMLIPERSYTQKHAFLLCGGL